MMDFVTIDFETAHSSRHNPCEIGITLVENWKVKDFYSWLIKPPCYPDFSPVNVSIHKITPELVANDRTFDQLWPEIRHYFDNYLVIAHNAKFDIDVLLKTLQHYEITPPDNLEYFCSLELAQEVFPALPSHSLDTICGLLGIELDNYHSAGPDAKATAEIVIRLCHHFGIRTTDDLSAFCECSCEFAASRRTERKQSDRMAFVLGEKYGFKVSKSSEQIEYTGPKPDPNNLFFGKLIALSGFSNDREANLSEVIEQVGGTFKKGSVTLKTDYLLVSMEYWSDPNKTSGKMKKATEYAERGYPIKIISETEFLNGVDHLIAPVE